MKAFVASIILLTFSQCSDNGKYSCREEFFDCAQACSSICRKTISRPYEYGKCFSICSYPCRKEYCEIKNHN
jgi:hypothetical protein